MDAAGRAKEIVGQILAKFREEGGWAAEASLNLLLYGAGEAARKTPFGYVAKEFFDRIRDRIEKSGENTGLAADIKTQLDILEPAVVQWPEIEAVTPAVENLVDTMARLHDRTVKWLAKDRVKRLWGSKKYNQLFKELLKKLRDGVNLLTNAGVGHLAQANVQTQRKLDTMQQRDERVEEMVIKVYAAVNTGEPAAGASISAELKACRAQSSDGAARLLELKLLAASFAGQIEDVRGLLESGVNRRALLKSDRVNFEVNALHAACIGGHRNILMLICFGEQQLDIHSRDRRGRLALHHAAAHNRILCLRWLVGEHREAARSDDGDFRRAIDAEDQAGLTPLMRASHNGAYDAVVCLVEEAGANVDAGYKGGFGFQTALKLARQENHARVAKYLERKGAKELRDSAQVDVEGTTAARTMTHTPPSEALTVTAPTRPPGGRGTGSIESTPQDSSGTVAHSLAQAIYEGGDEGEVESKEEEEKKKTPLAKLLRRGHEIKEHFVGGIDSGRKIDEYLASGTYGDVYKVIRTRTGKMEAMKMVRLMDPKTGEPLSREERLRRLRPHVLEAHIMCDLGSHPNLVGIRAFYTISNDCFVFMDLVPGVRTLRSVIKQDPMNLALPVAAEIALKMARGVAFMHERGFTHWDLKPCNVLTGAPAGFGLPDEGPPVTGAGSLTIKIADFGSTTKRGSGVYKASTLEYGSPETYSIHMNTGRTAEEIEEAAATQDTWSLGAVLLEMMLKKRSWFGHHSARQALEKLSLWSDASSSSSSPSPGGSAESCDGDHRLRVACASLAIRCLDVDPLSRPDMATIVKELTRGFGDAAVASMVAAVEGGVGGSSKPDLSSGDLGRLHNEFGGTFLFQLAGSPADFELAERHYLEFERIVEETDGPESSEFATALNNRATLYEAQGRHVEAISLHERALAIWEKALGPGHKDVAASCSNLGLVHYRRIPPCMCSQGNYAKAKPLHERALEIDEKAHGPGHHLVAISCNNLALVHAAQGNFAEAKRLYERSLEISEKALGGDHERVAATCLGLGVLLRDQGTQKSDLDEAMRLIQRSITIKETTLGLQHPSLGLSYGHLSELLRKLGRYQEALQYNEKALKIFETALPADHQEVKNAKDRQAELRRLCGQ